MTTTSTTRKCTHRQKWKLCGARDFHPMPCKRGARDDFQEEKRQKMPRSVNKIHVLEMVNCVYIKLLDWYCLGNKHHECLSNEGWDIAPNTTEYPYFVVVSLVIRFLLQCTRSTISSFYTFFSIGLFSASSYRVSFTFYPLYLNRTLFRLFFVVLLLLLGFLITFFHCTAVSSAWF